jgi:formylglycine-generating enzyme required for sulfatase activity
MKKKDIIWIYLLIIFVFTNGCKKEFSVPILTTSAITNLSATDAVCGGNVTLDGGSAVTVRGICWSLRPGPTEDDNKTTNGNGLGNFVSSLTGLTANTTYYMRAYATNDVGTGYGDVLHFTTQSIPMLSTSTMTVITQTTAICGGKVISDGRSAVTMRGICWSMNPNPTIVDNKTTDGNGLGNFVSSITGLIANTTYYVRAYATNKNGTAYGSEILFVTVKNVETVNIPAGTFVMGRQVTLSTFNIGKYEITNDQFASFLNAKGIGSDCKYTVDGYGTQVLLFSTSSPYDWGLHYTDGQWVPATGFKDYPVIHVTWFGAIMYARYMGGRLPTEAEWEYACRAGTNTPFNTGNCLTNEEANYNWSYPYGTCTNTNTNKPGKTQAVGTYPANAWGLFDMHGNVSEWCSDWYGVYPTIAETNPTGSSSGTKRVCRGGDYFGSAIFCSSTNRFYADPYNASSGLGFRLVFP